MSAISHSERISEAASPRQRVVRYGGKLRRFVKNPLRAASLFVVVGMIVVAVLAPRLAPYDPLAIESAPLQPPSGAHWFGTDDIGRDVLSRVIWGSRVSLRVGFLSAAASTTLGVVLGLLGGYFGGWLGFLILRFTDLLMAFPGILLALVVVAVVGPGLDNVMLAVGIAGVPTFTRVVYGAVLAIKQNEYVEASRSLGSGQGRIIFRHLLPNVAAPIIVLATLQIGTAIFLTSSLSFIGLGAQPPIPEWGTMVSRGRYSLSNAMWMSTFPGLAVAATVTAFNVLGDALRDELDPRMRL